MDADKIIFRSLNFLIWNRICLPENVGILLTRRSPITIIYTHANLGVSNAQLNPKKECIRGNKTKPAPAGVGTPVKKFGYFLFF